MNERVKKLRNNLGLTLEKFGENLGVGKNAISRIETGKSKLTNQMFTAICNVNWDGKYVNEEWLRSGTGEMFKASPTEVLDALAEEYGLTHEDYVLVEKFVNLKAEKRAAVVDYVLQAAAAMQSEGADPAVPAIIPEPQTTTKEEKIAAYQEYLDEKEKLSV